MYCTEDQADIMYVASEQDDEFDQVFIAFKDARDALKNAQVARGFFPVVVPSSTENVQFRIHTSDNSKKKKGGKGKRTGKGSKTGKRFARGAGGRARTHGDRG